MSRDYFQRIAPTWDELRSTLYSTRVRDEALKAAGVRPGQTVLDVGAGTGFVTEALLASGCRVVAIDESPAMLAELRAKERSLERLQVMEATAERVPLLDACVDHVLANMALHHVEHPDRMIREMARVTRPGGRVIVTDMDEHTHTWLKEQHHDRWMGFRRPIVHQWFEAAGLHNVRVGAVGDVCSSTQAETGLKADVSLFLAHGRVHG